MRATRRDALTAIGVTAAVTATAGIGLKRGDPRKQRLTKTSAATREPRWMSELDGARFAGCLVHEVGPVKHGSVPVTFTDATGEFFVVDVLRHDPATPGVARAGSLAVFMNVGARADAGDRPTIEEHGLAAMALATELSRREEAGAKVPALRTLSERAAIRSTA